uniref:Jupiter microtubule associated homolog 1b n=1 Tax=Oryzias latipes TaxID=8090 RepID=A0A3P9L535_ORYLA
MGTATSKMFDLLGSVQSEKSSVMSCPIRADDRLVGWSLWAGTAEPADLGFPTLFQFRVESAARRISERREDFSFCHPFHCSLQPGRLKPPKMTTTTTYTGMEPGAKSSSRVLRPPGGDSSISFGTDDNTTPQRKNKMASNIFAEPDDPHAHRRNNPPTGEAAGTLCGEPSAPLRRCQQPLLFPKNPEPELTTIHNSGAALVWTQRRENENGQEPQRDGGDCPEEEEAEQDDHRETQQSPAPSGGANNATGSRRNPPGGKSSLILG